MYFVDLDHQHISWNWLFKKIVFDSGDSTSVPKYQELNRYIDGMEKMKEIKRQVDLYPRLKTSGIFLQCMFVLKFYFSSLRGNLQKNRVFFPDGWMEGIANFTYRTLAPSISLSNRTLEGKKGADGKVVGVRESRAKPIILRRNHSSILIEDLFDENAGEYWHSYAFFLLFQRISNSPGFMELGNLEDRERYLEEMENVIKLFGLTLHQPSSFKFSDNSSILHYYTKRSLPDNMLMHLNSDDIELQVFHDALRRYRRTTWRDDDALSSDDEKEEEEKDDGKFDDEEEEEEKEVPRFEQEEENDEEEDKKEFEEEMKLRGVRTRLWGPSDSAQLLYLRDDLQIKDPWRRFKRIYFPHKTIYFDSLRKKYHRLRDLQDANRLDRTSDLGMRFEGVRRSLYELRERVKGGEEIDFTRKHKKKNKKKKKRRRNNNNTSKRKKPRRK